MSIFKHTNITGTKETIEAYRVLHSVVKRGLLCCLKSRCHVTDKVFRNTFSTFLTAAKFQTFLRKEESSIPYLATLAPVLHVAFGAPEM